MERDICETLSSFTEPFLSGNLRLRDNRDAFTDHYDPHDPYGFFPPTINHQTEKNPIKRHPSDARLMALEVSSAAI